jgi:glutathione peroxidase
MLQGKLKPTAIVLVLMAVGFCFYLQWANQKSVSMTAKQKMIRAIYPTLMGLTKLFGKNTKKMKNPAAISPPVSFYSLKATSNSGKEFSFDQFRGKKVLLINTASDCGYTPQYDDLQALHKQYGPKLVIVGFPANDFGQQEKGSDQEISQFCKLNYGVEFMLAQKSSVIKGPSQNKVFEWLSARNENGWNDQAPTWNFSKYLINEQGQLAYYFDPSISPSSKEFLAAVTESN